MAGRIHLKAKSKYRAVPVVVAGIRFASKREAACYQQLKHLQNIGDITDLQLQVPFTMKVNGKVICRFIADFTFRCNGRYRVADAKGFRTPVYKIKKKLMAACHGIEIEEL